MADPNRPILLLAAIEDEIKPTLRAIKARIATGEVVPCVTGMGRTRVLAALERALEEHRPRQVLHVGVAGGLRPGFDGATVVRRAITPDGNELILGTTGRTVLTSGTPAITVAEKAELFARFNADMIDMETHHVASYLAKRDIGFTAIRAVCDTAEDSIPSESMDWVDDRGRPRATAAMRHLATHPWHLPTLLRMAKRMKLATLGLVPLIKQELARITQT